MFSRASNADISKTSNNIDIKSEEFFDYIQTRNFDKVKEYFGNTDYKVWQLKDENGYTALHKSVFNGDLEMTKLIIDQIKKRLGLGSTAAVSKFINEKTNEGLSALHYASYKGNIDIFDLLIKNGASLEAVTNLGKNILHSAAEGNQPSMIIYLITQHGQDIHSVDENGSTPLHWACYSGSEEAVNFLIYLNSKINAQDKEKLTPLHLASLGGKEKIVLRLLQKNADKTLADNKGELPIDLARRKNHSKIVALLENTDYNPLCSLETPKEYIEPNDVYKKLILLMLGIPEVIIFILVLPFLNGPVNTFINLITFAVTLLVYVILIGKDPGYRSNSILILEAGNDYPLKKKVLEKVDVRNYCPKCFLQKSLNITHCYICDKCVDDFHHHCFWINKCIGRGNAIFYFLFILACLVYANHTLFMCFELFFDNVNLPYEKQFPPVWFNFGRDRGFRILGGAIVGVFALVAALPLWFLLLIEILKAFGAYGNKKPKEIKPVVEHEEDGKKIKGIDLVDLQAQNEPLLPNKEEGMENKDEDVEVKEINAINTISEKDEGEGSDDEKKEKNKEEKKEENNEGNS